MKEYALESSDCVYVGDGQSDMEAATLVGMPFILRKTPENQNLQVTHHIDDIHQLKDKLNEINGGIHVK